MSGIIKCSDRSYRITYEPEPNKKKDVYVFNGLSVDLNGNKETIKMVFVRNYLQREDLRGFGHIDKICKVPDYYSDAKFHERYNIDMEENSSFDLYVGVSDERVIEEMENKKHSRLKIIIISAIVLTLLLFVSIITAFKIIEWKHEKSANNNNAISSELDIIPATSVNGELIHGNASFGDMNGDGVINAIDASFILGNYYKLSTGEEITEEQKEFGDINRDGKLDATDASIILGYYSYLATNDYISLEEYLKQK